MKRLPLLSILALGTLVLSGCGITNSPVDDNTTPVDQNDDIVVENFETPTIDQNYVDNAEAILIGLSSEDAETVAKDMDIPFRVVMIDGEIQATTKDFRIGRVNATIDDNIVTSIDVEGFEEEPEDDPATIFEITEEDIELAQESFVGLSLEEAEELANETNTPFRVVMIDGEGLPVTMDYRPDRINAVIEDNIVVDVDLG